MHARRWISILAAAVMTAACSRAAPVDTGAVFVIEPSRPEALHRSELASSRLREQASALWLSLGDVADHARLEAAMEHLDGRLDRAKNPLVEDLDDEPIQVDAKRVKARFASSFAVAHTLLRIDGADGICTEQRCVRIAARCPPGAECLRPREAYADPRTRLLVWPLASGARLSCTDPAAVESAAARLREVGNEPSSTIGWAVTARRGAGNDVRGSARSLVASMEALPDASAPTWLTAIAAADEAPRLEWLPELAPALVSPKLSKLVEQQAFLAEAGREVAPFGCTVSSLATP